MSFSYDGLDPIVLARRLGLPRVQIFDHTTSTMDEAHALAAHGAPAGTLVLAHQQTAGRGRSGGRWLSEAGASVLCTLVERPSDPAALEVLSLRVGLGAACALDAIAGQHVQVKWPNDLFVSGGKMAGVLIETRWRRDRPEWVAIAMGINIGAPPAEAPGAAGLPAGTSRLDVLGAITPAMRQAAAGTGPLTDAEMAAWAGRDFLAGRRVREPVVGVIRGILRTGELLIETPEGPASYRTGRLTLEDS
jgi:BirA family biotin operon repressor/biotin-[acetyl-CoA-carboxylase] ligase